MNQRIAGIIQAKVGGVLRDAAGEWTYNLGRPLREAVVGQDAVHGYTETPQVAFIEGEITDTGSLDVDALTRIDGETITLSLANGKVVALGEAWFAGEGTVNTKTSAVPVRFEGKTAEEIK